MSVTIGIALSKGSNEKAIEFVSLVARDHGYRIAVGSQSADADVSAGFKNFLQVGVRFSKQIKFEEILFLMTDDNPSGTMAFGIYQEFQNWHKGGNPPQFLSFLSQISHVFDDKSVSARFLFCSEFAPSDEVLVRRGTFSDLIKFLELPDFWTISLWSPETGILQETDRYPVVFCVR